MTGDAGNSGFAGVTVVIKGTTIGTVTDVKGAYQLSVPASGNTLVFSAVGMQTTEEAIGARRTINVLLKTDTNQLGEIIVTALGLKEERDKFASSVSTVGDKNIAQSGETGLLSANTKTDETVLYTHYYKVGISTAGALNPNTDDGAFTADAPHPIITYYENGIILAEAQARLGVTDKALAALNTVRAGLASGYINGKKQSATGLRYDAYALTDLAPTGLANQIRFGPTGPFV